MAPPRFIKFVGVDLSVGDAVSLKFLGADGLQYTAELAAAVLPATIAALIARGGQIRAGNPPGKGRPAVAQPLLPTGFHVGANEAGLPVIYFQFGGGGALPIQLTRDQLQDVRRLVSELDRLTAPTPDGKIQ